MELDDHGLVGKGIAKYIKHLSLLCWSFTLFDSHDIEGVDSNAHGNDVTQ